MKQFDELGDISPTNATVATVPTVAPVPTTAPEVEDILPRTNGATASKRFSWDSDELEKGGDNLERIRPERGSDRTVRFSVLPFGPVVAHRNHFIPTQNGKSCRLCLSEDGSPAYCCQKLGEDGRLRIAALALHYTNADKNGGYGKGVPIEWKIGYVELSPAHFKTIRNLQPEADVKTPVTDLDLGMSYDNNRFAFRLVSLKARWKQIPELARKVEEAAQRIVADGGRCLEKRLGKKTSLNEWKTLLKEAGTEQAALDDLENTPF